MSYMESIIIPLETFRKCNFRDTNTISSDTNSIATTEKKHLKGIDILQDSNCPEDVKLKLFQQNKNLRLKRKIDTTPSTNRELQISNILEGIAINSKPYALAILRQIEGYDGGILTWDSNYNITVDGKLIPNSNIIELLQFITNSKIVTSDSDKPIGIEQFYEALDKLNVPKTWIKRTIRLSTKRKKGILTPSPIKPHRTTTPKKDSWVTF